MHGLYLAAVWLHLLAAITWVGGMLFLMLVVVPWLRAGGRAQAPSFLRETGRRFRTLGWICFALLLVTGSFNLWVRGVRLGDFARAEWLGTPFGHAVVLKLTFFGAALLVSALHDFSVGPRATEAVAHGQAPQRAERLRRAASWLGRTNAVIALALVALGVVLVRGWP